MFEAILKLCMYLFANIAFKPLHYHGQQLKAVFVDIL